MREKKCKVVYDTPFIQIQTVIFLLLVTAAGLLFLTEKQS